MNPATQQYTNGIKPTGGPSSITMETAPEMPAWMLEDNAQQEADLGVWAPAPKMIAKTATMAKGERLDKFERLSMDDLEAMPPKEWIIENIVGPGDLVMIYGAPGCGKTFVIIDMIFAACLGQQFAMRFGVARRLNVAYCAGEGNSGLPQRFKAAREFYGAKEETFPNFSYFKTPPQLYAEDGDEAHAASVMDFVREWKWCQAQPLDILIIDTFHSATAGADENSAKDMGKVLHAAKYAATELGCAVILVHHTNKNGSAERGSSTIRGAMDCMIEIRRNSDTSSKAAMYCAKLKDGEQWKAQTFDLVAKGDSVRVWWDKPSEEEQDKGKDAEDKRTMLSFMQARPGTKLAAKTLAEVAGVAQVKAGRILSKMVNAGDCKSELMFPERKSSNRNPLAYFVA